MLEHTSPIDHLPTYIKFHWCYSHEIVCEPNLHYPYYMQITWWWVWPENKAVTNLGMLDDFLNVAVNHLNGAMLYGKKIHVTLSKHTQVQMPQPGSNMSALVGLMIALLARKFGSCTMPISSSLHCRRMVSQRTTLTLLSIVSRWARSSLLGIKSHAQWCVSPAQNAFFCLLCLG